VSAELGDKAAFPPRDARDLLAAADERRAAIERGVSTEKEIQLIHFDLGPERYGIPLDNVAKIERVPDVVGVPRTPPFVKGIASLRGEIVCVVDLRALLGLPPSDAAPRGLVVVQSATRKVALLSDTLPDFLRVFGSAIQPAPAGPGSEVLAGVLERDGRTIAILAPERLLDLIGGQA
jgi:purine-binding chemotaxis protein CheW